MDYSDSHLLEQLRKGDNEAYAILYERYKNKIYNYVWNLLNYDTDGAITVISDVFIKLYEYGQSKEIDNFRALAYKIAHNLSINRMQKYKSETYIANDEQRDQLEDTTNEWEKEKINNSFRADLMKECLTGLNEEQREVIYLYYHDEKSYDDIAAIIGSNKNTIWTIILRAKKKLKDIATIRWFTDIFIS